MLKETRGAFNQSAGAGASSRTGEAGVVRGRRPRPQTPGRPGGGRGRPHSNSFVTGLAPRQGNRGRL